MSRNWQADTNPHPKRWRPRSPGSTIGHRPDPDHGWSADRAAQVNLEQIPVYLTDGTVYIPLRQLPVKFKVAISEAVEFFNRLHPTPRAMRGI